MFAGDELTTNALKSALLREAQVDSLCGKRALGRDGVIRADRMAKTGKVQELIQICQEAEFDTFALRGRQSDRSTLIEE